MSNEKNIQIPRCYDSHVHWLATGEKLNILNLSKINSLKDLTSNSSRWQQPNRGNWIIGFGWDQNQWSDPFLPHHNILDQLFPHNPVSFARADGHSSWVNKMAMQLAGIKDGWVPNIPSGGRIEIDQMGAPTGIFVDAAKEYIDKVIPPPTKNEMKNYMMQGMEVFLKAGFTHIRDVGGCAKHWEIANELERDGALNFFVEMYFNLDDIESLNEKIKEIIESRSQSSEHLRLGGLKLFYDGALGSDGAFLSQNYPGQNHSGLRLLELSKVEEVFHRCWEKNIPVAIHTLGDEAVHQVVLVANRLKERGIEGKLNLEHCEVVRDETISKMKGLDIHCHLQPSHFISDRKWLKNKLGNLYQYSFPWKKLVDASIPMSFGSDSPIEQPSVKRTIEALFLAKKEGIALPNVKEPLFFHSHPDSGWGGNCVTEVIGEDFKTQIMLN